MSVAKLSKQLKRELKANPQKAGMLGLLCAVAAYFWGPLVFKSEETKKPAPAVGAAPVAATATAPTGPQSPTAGTPRMEWRVLSSRLQADPLMRSVPGKSANDELRNPFGAAVKKKEETSEDDVAALLEEAAAAGLFDEEKPAPSIKMSAAALNTYPLTLTSTLVGPRARTAVINGKAYVQGAAIGQINEVELVLETVDPRSATVAWNGARRELRIPRPGERVAGDDSETNDAKTKATEENGDSSSETETSEDVFRAILSNSGVKDTGSNQVVNPTQ
ncbi:MAG: hypothetical protein K8U03_10285 [Planctomycetia bacterium]|nr:hypothetical protein [Planctomycetia bacterium]